MSEREHIFVIDTEPYSSELLKKIHSYIADLTPDKIGVKKNTKFVFDSIIKDTVALLNADNLKAINELNGLGNYSFQLDFDLLEQRDEANRNYFVDIIKKECLGIYRALYRSIDKRNQHRFIYIGHTVSCAAIKLTEVL